MGVDRNDYSRWKPRCSVCVRGWLICGSVTSVESQLRLELDRTEISMMGLRWKKERTVQSSAVIWNITYWCFCASVVFTFCVSRRRREMYSGHAYLCVCLSPTAFSHYCMDPDLTLAMGGFAIGVRFSLLWQNSVNAKCQRVLCTLSLPGFFAKSVVHSHTLGHTDV